MCIGIAVPLDVRGVTKAFHPSRLAFGRRRKSRGRSHVAVRDVSFRMQLGEIYGVIGANGSGKSTLIRILSTLLLPDAGDVRVFGRDAIRDPLSVRGLLNRVSADPSFFRAMSAMENLLFFGRAYGMSGSLVRRRIGRGLLRRHVHRRADVVTRLGYLGRSFLPRCLHRLGDSEIGDDRRALAKQNVLGLDVAVHNSLPVRVGES